jgi:hypothetical protein
MEQRTRNSGTRACANLGHPYGFAVKKQYLRWLLLRMCYSGNFSSPQTGTRRMPTRECLVAPDTFRCESSQFPHLAKTRPDMGHPRFVVGRNPMSLLRNLCRVGSRPSIRACGRRPENGSELTWLRARHRLENCRLPTRRRADPSAAAWTHR